jgi:hypothetical protein
MPGKGNNQQSKQPEEEQKHHRKSESFRRACAPWGKGTHIQRWTEQGTEKCQLCLVKHSKTLSRPFTVHSQIEVAKYKPCQWLFPEPR